MSRTLRVSLTLLVTGLCTAYVLWKIDIGKTIDVIANADPLYFTLALAIMIVTILPMAWRWQLMLRAKDVEEGIPWLTRARSRAGPRSRSRRSSWRCRSSRGRRPCKAP